LIHGRDFILTNTNKLTERLRLACAQPQLQIYSNSSNFLDLQV
jgi:hypothetical protein